MSGRPQSEEAVATGARAFSERDLRAISRRLALSGQHDLRQRIADGLQSWLTSTETSEPILIPSTRRLSEALSVHRATVNASLEILVERSVLTRSASGRYLTARKTSAVDTTATAHQLYSVARRAAQDGLTQGAFTELAGRVFQRASAAEASVVFLHSDNRISGIGAREVEAILKVQVNSMDLAEFKHRVGVVYVADVNDIELARATVGQLSDVFAVGLALDADIRQAVIGLPAGDSVAVVAGSAAEGSRIAAQVARHRPDLSVEVLSDLAEATSGVVTLVPAAWMPPETAGIHPYRASIVPSELVLVRSRMQSNAETFEFGEALAEAASRQP